MTPTENVIHCTGCDKSYKVNFDKMKGEIGKLTCKNCHTVNKVVKPNHDLDVSTTPQKAKAGRKKPAKASLAASRKKARITGFSIRSKITLIVVLLVLGSLTCVGLIASTKSRSALLAQAEVQLGQMTRQKAAEYALIFNRISGDVQAVADYAQKAYAAPDKAVDLGLSDHLLMPWTGSGYGSAALDRKLAREKLVLQQVVLMLKSLVAKNPYVTLGYLGSDTNIMAIHDPSVVVAIGKLKGFINSQRPWYLKAKAEGKTIWSAPYVDANTKDLIVTCATPVYGPNKTLLGVVGYDVLLKTIQKDILNLKIGYNSYALLVDSKGKALVRPGMDRKDIRWDASYKTEDLLHTDNSEFNGIVAHMVEGQTAVDSYKSANGEKYIAYAALPAIDASLAIVASKNAVVEPAKQIQTYIIMVWAVVLAIAVAIGFVVGNGITRPIQKLTEAADLISQGQMDLDVLPETRKDEIGLLTKAFNRLVTSLKIALGA